MIEILHYLKDPKLWELWYIPYYGCKAGFISSTVLGFRVGCYGTGRRSSLGGLRLTTGDGWGVGAQASRGFRA